MSALTRNPSNIDLLQSTKFRVTFDRLPGATYFCQSANLPGVSLTEVQRTTPFVELYSPGEKIIYDTFNITFLVDEDMYAWTQIHDWIRGLTFPTGFEEYANLLRSGERVNTKPIAGSKPQIGNAILSIYTNKNNPNFRVKLIDIFPTTLSTIVFNTQDTAENIITADATFRFSYYNYERT